MVVCAVGMTDMIVNATNFRLVSTPASKYAHVPAQFTGNQQWGVAACETPLPAYDPYNPLHDRYAEGKPPCPRCVRKLRHHIEWTAAFEESYLMLEDEWENDTQ